MDFAICWLLSAALKNNTGNSSKRKKTKDFLYFEPLGAACRNTMRGPPWGSRQRQVPRKCKVLLKNINMFRLPHSAPDNPRCQENARISFEKLIFSGPPMGLKTTSGAKRPKTISDARKMQGFP